MTSTDTTKALRVWADQLMSLDRRNGLISFKAPKKSSLKFEAPSPDEILRQLREGRLLDIVGRKSETEQVDNPAALRGALCVTLPDDDVGPVCRSLMRKASLTFLERGLSVLYMAFGMLRWRDEDGHPMESPLYLVPVEFMPDGPRAKPRLRASDDDPLLNPALPLSLKEYGVRWPSLQDVEEKAMGELIEHFRAALSASHNFRDWELLSDVYLGVFSFAKEAMYRDLVDNEALIAQHPIVQALANPDPASQSDAFQFDGVDLAEIDQVLPAHLAPLVLDADSSQRAAVAAAVAGKSFVMDGPPGTGKSQTIANMIGALLHAGKTVLFVSEKIAALDVVKNRLTEVGVGHYLLELHSHQAKRIEVAKELKRTLENEPQPPAELPQATRSALEDRRKKLTDYAMAMNERRAPLAESLHQVLGRLAQLPSSPVAPAPKDAPLDLDQKGLFRIRETLARLARAWRPAEQGSQFVWRDVIDRSSLGSRLYAAEVALDQLAKTMDLDRELVEQFELGRPDRARQLATLLHLQHADRPEQVKQSLLFQDWADIDDDRRCLGELLEAFRERAQEVAELSGAQFHQFSPEAPRMPGPAQGVAPLDPRPFDGEELRGAREFLRQCHRGLANSLDSLPRLAQLTGLPAPMDWADVDRVLRLMQLQAETSIESSWLTPSGLQAARESATAVRLSAMALDAAEQQAQSLYRPEVLTAPLHELQDRFNNLHKGLRKLSGGYRRDKQALAGLLSDAKQVKHGISRLADAVAWHDANRNFEMTGVAHAQSLGRHWAGRSTDWHRLERSLDAAEEIISLSGGAVNPQTAAFLAGSAESGYAQIAQSIMSPLATWRQAIGTNGAAGGPPELLMEPITSSVAWIDANLGTIEQGVARVEAVASVTGLDHTLEEADAILRASDIARSALAELVAQTPRFEAQFGELFQAEHTDLARLDQALGWAEQVRGQTTHRCLTPAQARSLVESINLDLLPEVISRWEDAREEVLKAFSATRREELLEELATFADAEGLMTSLREDPTGQQEWFDYLELLDELREFGLEAAVRFCIAERVRADDMPQVIERALLAAWADACIQTDSRLDPWMAKDRTALVEDFRQLDREVLEAAAGEIVRAANRLRPANTGFGDPGVIIREGSKSRRHIPVRELISKARKAVQAIKPIFMMSPLTVSQYLPSDLTFDVVIFDEASQVTPGDSINCIYRGGAFILAGDDKQLPPTQFFEHQLQESDDSEAVEATDFQSILELAKASGAFRNLGLRWHYRSRHEALIAFSNYKFYENNLVTYPSAQKAGEDVGVEFFHARGVYRRSRGADNPVEAQVVAQRVIHHFRSRPERSLGVVTFSVAQADAVNAAINELRMENRDLDGYFDNSDRLDGFFVRSLESVQGDERDVIIFSIGYGPDENGKISTNFGVLNRDKGWRRLNVAITRARRRVEVVASMTAADIPPSHNENVEALRSYLDFAERGLSVLGNQAAETGLVPESPFEESVLRVIESWGYPVEPQVGAAGYRIDLAVRHPDKPGLFVLGVECDGYQYHSSPSARDRDRLRDQVLTGLGWRMYRIWGTSWYRDRHGEEIRLREAIEAAISNTAPPRHEDRSPRQTIDTVPVDTDEAPPWAAEYLPANRVSVPSWVQPTDPYHVPGLIEPLRELARLEGPLHLETAAERVREWFGLNRVSSRVKQNLRVAVARAGLSLIDDFIDVRDRPVERVRCLKNRRRANHVHIDEFVLAVVRLTGDVGAASRDELVTYLARLFGWQRNGSAVTARLNRAIDRAIAIGRVIEVDDRITSGPTR